MDQNYFKDEILRRLLYKDTSIMDLEKIFNKESGSLDDIIDALENDNGFIKIIYEDGGGTYTLKRKGREFIERTSFELATLERKAKADQEANAKAIKEDRDLVEFNWKRRDEKRKNTTLVFGLIAAALGLWNVYNQVSSRGSMNRMTAKIDSISAIVHLSRLKIDSLSKITNASSTKKATDDAIKNVKSPAPTSINK